MCIVIPCYNEPALLQTLESVKKCSLPQSKVEVIVLINHSEIASEEIKNANRITKNLADKWIEENKTADIQFFAVGPV
jgi:glycosyltransferase involved in cell wall biosynthesis